METQLLVWWLTQADYQGFTPTQKRNPLKIPDYVWTEFKSRHGRGGRGRLWVPKHIDLTELPVPDNHPRWAELKDAGGIIIEAKDAATCALWGGILTTLKLEPVHQS